MEKSQTKVAKNIQKYIELVYSEDSSLNEIPDLMARKLEACNAAGLDPKKSDVDAIINMQNNEVNDLIIEFLIKNNSNDFSLLLADQHIFNSQIEKMMNPNTDIMERDKISERSDKLLDRINARLQSVFQGKEEMKVASDKIRIMRPEDRVKAIKSA